MNDNQPIIYDLTYPDPKTGDFVTQGFASWKDRSRFIRTLRLGPLSAREYRRNPGTHHMPPPLRTV